MTAFIAVTAAFGNGYIISNIDLSNVDIDGNSHPCGSTRSDGSNTWVFDGRNWQVQPPPYIFANSPDLDEIVKERRKEELMLEKYPEFADMKSQYLEMRDKYLFMRKLIAENE
jgi:hypothetical protein